MKQYEYMCVAIWGTGEPTTRRLNEFGREGWELVEVVWCWHYFKRELKEKHQLKELKVMTKKVDFQKDYKDLYLPKTKPMLIDVPPMNFIMIDGAGNPNQMEYQQAVGALYALAFTIKMSKMR